jgi:hypothetical protein
MVNRRTRVRALSEEPKTMPRLYVLTLKTWQEWDVAHHTYGRIRWSDDDGHGDADSETLPDADGIATIRHDTRESCIEGARRWYAAHAQPGDALIIGV